MFFKTQFLKEIRKPSINTLPSIRNIPIKFSVVDLQQILSRNSDFRSIWFILGATLYMPWV
jgi:hypothetical protein